ncbi:RHS repeat-associated core domain-containing protein [Pseudomonas purpurea]|uniref:RHS repeat domain-containing protein n=1 Tax=Pseudomonas purpurea TaxID=3136737 RepID=UPI003264EE76
MALVLSEQAYFLSSLDPPDWPLDIPARDACLEDEGLETSQLHAPSGEMLSQTDAMRNLRLFAYMRAGELKAARLKLAASTQAPDLMISDIHHNAFGQIVYERAENGVVTTAEYDAENQRLTRLLSRDPDGKPLQDLNYGYDPMGNISSLEDKAQLTHHFNQQRIDPINRYRYDSLYQLVEASGREVSQFSHGPALPVWQQTPLDPNQLRNYTQTFDYDAAGNLRGRQHSGAETFEMFASDSSNRSVARKEGLANGFDANGNQQELQRGQRMSWDVRNQLREVTLVNREDGADDTERYFYDRPGHRLQKVRLTQAASRTLRAEVRYLPGLEVHRDTATGEERHVISLEAGRSQVRALHWVTKPPKAVRNDQLRFSLGDHLGSSTVELDGEGKLLSQEGYYAFGGTAWWVGPSAIEVKYKTIRYSGKERDATGLYYYGYRYYAPWLQRWVSPDPAGVIDGLNLFLIVGNCPVSFRDENGLVKTGDISILPEKLGKWRLEKLQLSHSELISESSVGNNVVVNVNLLYKPDWRDRLLGSFQEVPNLIWHEKITTNDFGKNETWSFEADMFEHNPSSRTMEVWPKMYIEAYNSASNTPGIYRGAVSLHDVRGNKVTVDDLGGGVSDNNKKSKAVRSYLSSKGGVMSFEIHDVPSIVFREKTHKERLLEIKVGLEGARSSVSVSQYLSVDNVSTNKEFKRLIATQPVDMAHEGLHMVDPPAIVSERRPYLRAQGEFFMARKK